MTFVAIACLIMPAAYLPFLLHQARSWRFWGGTNGFGDRSERRIARAALKALWLSLRNPIDILLGYASIGSLARFAPVRPQGTARVVHLAQFALSIVLLILIYASADDLMRCAMILAGRGSG